MHTPAGFRTATRLLREGLVIAVVSLVLGEITLRIYSHFNPIFVFYDDSYNRFRGKPHGDDWGFKLNSKGFKDLEFGPKRGDVYRIIGIGDSFAYGVVPYRYNYLTILEEHLNEGRAVAEVLNLGIPSIGPRDYLSILVREGLALQPDMVILSFGE